MYDADGREEEVDLFFAAETATPTQIRQLRADAGGLVFLAVDPRVGTALSLPFLQDLYAEDSARHPILAKLIPNDIKYDTRSSFSLTLNHRQPFPGLPDHDRPLSVSEFSRPTKPCFPKPACLVHASFFALSRPPAPLSLFRGSPPPFPPASVRFCVRVPMQNVHCRQCAD